MRKMIFTLTILLPALAFAQKENKGTMLIGPSFFANKSLGSGIGAHLMMGPRMGKGVYLCFGGELIKFQNVQKVYIPITGNLLISPDKTKSDLLPIFNVAAGYGMYKESITVNSSVSGGFFMGGFGGFKLASGKNHPYLMLGCTSTTFSAGFKTTDRYSVAAKNTARYAVFSVRAGVNLR